MTTTPKARAALGLLVTIEALTCAWYVVTAGSSILEPRYLIYPYVWISVGALAIARAWPVTGSLRRRVTAGGVAVGYLGVLLVADGVVATSTTPLSITVSWLPPGWGPAVLATGAGIRIAILPFKLVGIVTLTYLVYARLVDAAAAATSAIVGVFSCVSCTYPILAALFAGGFGGGLVATIAQSRFAYDASTLVFLVTVVLLDRDLAVFSRVGTTCREIVPTRSRE